MESDSESTHTQFKVKHLHCVWLDNQTTVRLLSRSTLSEATLQRRPQKSAQQQQYTARNRELKTSQQIPRPR